MKSLETVIEAISIDLDLRTSCDKCPYNKEPNCSEKLLDDLLQKNPMAQARKQSAKMECH